MVGLRGIIISLLIFAIDVAAGMLGIEAQVAQNKAKHLGFWIFECREPSQDAFRLAIAAATLLGLAHVITNLLGGCMGICSKEELGQASTNYRQHTKACLVFSWIILVVGLSTLVIGIMSNHKSRTSCGFTHHRFLSIGGILCFVHALFSVAYYVSATTGQDSNPGSHV